MSILQIFTSQANCGRAGGSCFETSSVEFLTLSKTGYDKVIGTRLFRFSVYYWGSPHFGALSKPRKVKSSKQVEGKLQFKFFRNFSHENHKFRDKLWRLLLDGLETSTMNTIIIFAASYLYLIVLAFAVAVVMFADTHTKWNIARLTFVVFPLCFIIALILGRVIISPRPFMVDHVPPLIDASTDNGFPSDHTLLAMAAAATIFVYNRRVGSLLLLFALCVGIGRVLAQVHHPIDVIGSAVIALSVTAFAYRFIVNRIFLHWPNRQEGER